MFHYASTQEKYAIPDDFACHQMQPFLVCCDMVRPTCPSRSLPMLLMLGLSGSQLVYILILARSAGSMRATSSCCCDRTRLCWSRRNQNSCSCENIMCKKLSIMCKTLCSVQLLAAQQKNTLAMLMIRSMTSMTCASLLLSLQSMDSRLLLRAMYPGAATRVE